MGPKTSWKKTKTKTTQKKQLQKAILIEEPKKKADSKIRENPKIAGIPFFKKVVFVHKEKFRKGKNHP